LVLTTAALGLIHRPPGPASGDNDDTGESASTPHDTATQVA